MTLLAVGFFAGCELNDDGPEPDDPRDRFIGEWNVNEECVRLNYSVNITYDPDNSSQVLIANFGNPGPGFPPVPALVVNRSIYVNNAETGDDWVVNGEGVLVDGEVNWDYTISLSGSVLTCTSIYTR